MAENVNHPVRIDLNEFKLHIRLNRQDGPVPSFQHPFTKVLSLPDRPRRYRDEKKRESRSHIPPRAPGPSGFTKRNGRRFGRIVREGEPAAPDLSEMEACPPQPGRGPAFQGPGRKKEFDGVNGKAYQFTEPEKDQWANLFAYIGSEENVRLKFDLDKIGVNLNDVVVTYGELRNGRPGKASWPVSRGGKKNRKPNPTRRCWRSHGFKRPGGGEPDAPAKPVSSGGLDGRRPIRSGSGHLGTWKTVSKPAPVAVASIERMAYPLPDKPSIAVLPFDNLSGDPQQEFFSDGLTEEIITTLSKSPYLFVIARHSSFIYKGKSITVKQVAEELGVRYVLEGSVRRRRKSPNYGPTHRRVTGTSSLG